MKLSLEKFPKLKGKISSLNNYQLSKEDLIIAGRDVRFVSDLFSGEDAKIDPILLETYELLKPDGSLNRYDPTMKKRRFHELFLCQLNETSNSYQCARKALSDDGHVFI